MSPSRMMKVSAGCLRQPKRLFSESETVKVGMSRADNPNSQSLLRRKLHTSRVTIRMSTVPGAAAWMGTMATMLDSGGSFAL